MRRPEPAPDWPESWRTSFRFDLEEVFGEPRNLGYAYAYINRRKVALELLQDGVRARGLAP